MAASSSWLSSFASSCRTEDAINSRQSASDWNCRNAIMVNWSSSRIVRKQGQASQLTWSHIIITSLSHLLTIGNAEAKSFSSVTCFFVDFYSLRLLSYGMAIHSSAQSKVRKGVEITVSMVYLGLRICSTSLISTIPCTHVIAIVQRLLPLATAPSSPSSPAKFWCYSSAARHVCLKLILSFQGEATFNDVAVSQNLDQKVDCNWRFCMSRAALWQHVTYTYQIQPNMSTGDEEAAELYASIPSSLKTFGGLWETQRQHRIVTRPHTWCKAPQAPEVPQDNDIQSFGWWSVQLLMFFHDVRFIFAPRYNISGCHTRFGPDCHKSQLREDCAMPMPIFLS